MIYVFDSGPLIHLFRFFYREQFPSLWEKFDALVESKGMISVREVANELKNNEDQLANWAKANPRLFTIPSPQELKFVAEIFREPNYQLLIEEKKRKDARAVADPFLIARAKVLEATLVTSERKRRNATKIPAVCEDLGVDCVSLEEFMKREDWKF